MKNSVAAHYTHGQLLNRIVSAVEAIGKTAATVTVDELAALDASHRSISSLSGDLHIAAPNQYSQAV